MIYLKRQQSNFLKYAIKKKNFFCFLVCIIIFTIYPWPLHSDSPRTVSLKIYVDYLSSKEQKISELFNRKAITVCSIGPYDTFEDKRFHKNLNSTQIFEARNILDEINLRSLGDNNFILIGFNENGISYVYKSNFFLNAASTKGGDHLPDCISDNGKLKVRKTNSGRHAIELGE